MATSIRVEMNRAGAIEILQSDGVMNDLKARGQRVLDAAGASEHELTASIGRTRARVSVITVTQAARRAEAESRNLTRALDAARDGGGGGDSGGLVQYTSASGRTSMVTAKQAANYSSRKR